MQKGFNLIIIVLGLVGIVVIASGIFYFGVSTGRKMEIGQQLVDTVNKSPQTASSSSNKKSTWQTYTSGQNINGITINYPAGWKVNYKKETNLSSDYTAKHRISFDFAPSTWKETGYSYLGWGSLYFDVYDPQTDATKFINTNYPTYKDNLTTKVDTRIGDRPTYLEEGKEDFYWLPRNIVLGSQHSYEVGHSQDGSDEFIGNVKTKTGIFEYIKID